jgi:A/G-specific adenine glycosylase
MVKYNSFLARLKSWTKSNLRNFEWRKSNDPYTVLVSEILLRRTTSKAVKRIFKKFLSKYSSINALNRTPRKELEEFLKPIGYYKERAKILKTISRFIQKKFEGKVPDDITELTSIPHIGRYTAGAILSMAYNKPYPMIDSNVKRVIGRFFLGKDSNVKEKEVENIILRLLPASWHKEFNLGLIDLGGTLCLPRHPKCYRCPLNKDCKYNLLNSD